MPTTNPVPSTDPSDLLFNAGKLDEVVNGTANSFIDRLGIARRTVAGMNADFDAQLADAESDLNVYRSDAAASAAESLGYLQTIRATSYGAYANDPATDPLGNPPTVGDEYFNSTANLLKRWNGTTWQASDINTANLASSSGSSLVGYDGGTVQDVLDGAKSLQDYAALRAYTGRAKRIYITGLLGTAKPAGISGPFHYDPTDTTRSDNGGTIIVGVDGSRWKRDFIGPIHTAWFGTKGDRDVDDTIAAQKAIDACLATSRAIPLAVDGNCKITSSLIVNRMVDTTLNEFTISGNGGNGFFVSSAITIFDSTLPVTTVPLSEFVTFDGVVFESSDALLDAYIINHKFLRIKFAGGCVGQRIKIVNSPIYLQSWRILECNFRNWKNGALFDCAGDGYDIHSTDTIYEFGHQAFHINSAKGSSFVGNVCEGARSGGFLHFNGVQGALVEGNYTEGNVGVDYRFFDGYGGVGLVFSGNNMVPGAANLADPNYYPVVWGAGGGAVSSGNRAYANMHYDTLMPIGGLKSIGDECGGIKQKSNTPIEVLASGLKTKINGITALVGGGQPGATLLTKSLNRVTTSTTSNIDSVLLPATTAVTETFGREITVINDTTNSIVVWPSGTDTINFVSSFTMGPLSMKTFVNSHYGRWNCSTLRKNDTPNGQLTYDPPVISAGSRHTFTVNCPGAESGSAVLATPVSALPNGIIMMNPGRMGGAGVVQIDLYNITAADIDPPANTWNVRVIA